MAAVGALLTVELAFGVHPAHAAATCNGQHNDAHIPQSLIVPEDGSCVLAGTTVAGSIEVRRRALLWIAPSINDPAKPSRVHGSITVRAGSLYADSAVVGGSIAINRALRPFGHQTSIVVRICESRIGSSLAIKNTPHVLAVSGGGGHSHVGGQACDFSGTAGGNRIGGSTVVAGNRAPVTVRDNAIAGSLKCADNDPQPDIGNNAVLGSVSPACS